MKLYLAGVLYERKGKTLKDYVCDAGKICTAKQMRGEEGVYENQVSVFTNHKNAKKAAWDRYAVKYDSTPAGIFVEDFHQVGEQKIWRQG